MASWALSRWRRHQFTSLRDDLWGNAVFLKVINYSYNIVFCVIIRIKHLILWWYIFSISGGQRHISRAKKEGSVSIRASHGYTLFPNASRYLIFCKAWSLSNILHHYILYDILYLAFYSLFLFTDLVTLRDPDDDDDTPEPKTIVAVEVLDTKNGSTHYWSLDKLR